MKSYEKYKEFLENVPFYTSLKEKNSVIFTLDSKVTPAKIARTLGLNPKTEMEALAMIFQSRKKSHYSNYPYQI